MESFYLIALQE